MKFATALFTLSITILSVTHGVLAINGESINCYECEGTEDQCYIRKCEGKYCYKFWRKEFGSDEYFVSKGCADIGAVGCFSLTHHGAEALSCNCDQPFCNNANTAYSVLSIFVTTIISFLTLSVL